MCQIRNAIHKMYREGKFSDESQVKTFQKINQKRISEHHLS